MICTGQVPAVTAEITSARQNQEQFGLWLQSGLNARWHYTEALFTPVICLMIRSKHSHLPQTVDESFELFREAQPGLEDSQIAQPQCVAVQM